MIGSLFAEVSREHGDMILRDLVSLIYVMRVGQRGVFNPLYSHGSFHGWSYVERIALVSFRALGCLCSIRIVFIDLKFN